jgi:hypothetical protein
MKTEVLGMRYDDSDVRAHHNGLQLEYPGDRLAHFKTAEEQRQDQPAPDPWQVRSISLAIPLRRLMLRAGMKAKNFNTLVFEGSAKGSLLLLPTLNSCSEPKHLRGFSWNRRT